MVFQCINIRQVPWEVLKTAAFGLGFQHLPRDLANVNAWKTLFHLCINRSVLQTRMPVSLQAILIQLCITHFGQD